MNDKIKKALGNICKSIQKEYGEESINFLGNNNIKPMERLPSSCATLDSILGGGWPLGRIVELFGPESSGKSTVCYHAIAEAQKLWPDIPVGLIDVEYSFDPTYAANLGVKVDELLVSQPDDGTDGLNILIKLIESGVKLVIVDSVAALMPKEESDTGIEKQTMGLQARLMSKALRKVTSAAGRSKAVVMFTNQVRDKIGVLYGNPETTPGGNALKFYASIRLRLSSAGKNTATGGEVISIKSRANVVKNKTAPPFRNTELLIKFGSGIDSFDAVVTSALDMGLFEKAGSWYSYQGEKLGQGRNAVEEFLKTNEKVMKEVEQKVITSNTNKIIIPSAEDLKEAEESEIDPETVVETDVEETKTESVETGEV